MEHEAHANRIHFLLEEIRERLNPYGKTYGLFIQLENAIDMFNDYVYELEDQLKEAQKRGKETAA